MNTSYENQICEAIEYIVDHAIARAGFDKTIQATVVSCVDETIGQYKVKYQNSSFHAYANSTEVTYSSGTDVYILVPGNDMSKTKTILGAVDKLGTDFVKTLDVVDSFEITGNNCINSAETFELCSYEEKDVVILYNQADGTDLINLNTVGFEEYIRQSSYIMCGAYFKTQLNTEQRFKGNYGIAFDIAFKSSASDEDVIKNYVIDIDQMTGSPYTFNNFTKQMGTFNIDAENFLYVDKIYIFSYDFPNLKDNQPNDIFVKDIQLCCANEISKEDLETYYLVLNTPEGSYFDGVDEDSKEKPIQAQVKIQGKSIDVESQSVEYYWFRENAKVTNAHVKYCKYGGRGWECLNDYNQIADDLIEWVPSTYEYKIKKSDCRAKETVYKCVVVYGEVVIENSITIKNFGSNYTISIEATDGTDFYFDRGTTSLICLVNGEQETRNYSYVWVENTNLGGYNQLNPTTDLNDAYSNAYNEYYDLLLDIEEERVMAEAVQDELNEKLTILKEYDTIMRVEDNIIYNLDISSISNFSIYKCSVFYNEIYIGTSSVTITNTHEVETGYNLIINDGEKTYQYDENGTSPASSSKVSPLEIKPITFDIYDNLGKSFDKETLEKCSIQWIAPKENTMLVFEEIPTRETENSLIYEDVLELNYSIAPKYDLNKINNTIQLIVTYQGLVLVGTTNIAFTKQGDPGTNGTDYVCRIVPNVAEGADESAPMLTNGVLNYEPEEDGVWFKVQLWKNAENIFEGNESGSSLEGKRAVINWNVLKNKYTYQISDVSNLNLLDAKKGKFAYQDVAAGRQPANIVECTVEYDGMVYYATLPVLVATAANGYAVELKEDTGFSYVIYSSDGTMPKYDEELPFEINTYKVIDNVKTNISTLSGDHRVYLNYYINGSVYDIDEEDWVDSIHLEEAYSYREDLQKNQIRLRPTDTFSGHCVNNAIECIITDKDNNDVASIIIPIYFCLNRYGLAALNGWNGNSIAINEDGGFILAPQVGAGKKEEDNSFTGIFMGVVKETGSSKDETGLFAYKSGVRSIFLDAESGNATFGTSEGSQFVITPATAADSNDKKVIAIHDNVKQDDVFYVTKGGDLFIKGDGSELNITANKALIDITDDVGELESRIEAAEGDIELSVRKDNIIQSINLSTENGATINAQKINLKGAVTMSAFDAEVTDKIDSIDEQIVDIEVQYYSSSSKDRLEGGQWGVENPDWQEGRYIWTKNIYYYLDTSIEPGESVPVCITGNTGAAGKPGVGVSEIIEWYLVSSKNEGIIAGEGTWYTTPPEMNATDKYLWNYTEVKYSEDQPASLTEAVIIGVFGKGIESTVEYYLATSRDSGITQDTTGWTTDPTAAKMTAVNKYLWNYEQINYTDDSVVETKPVIIGVYGDKGADGTAIVSITNYYLKSSQNGGVTIEGYTWDTTIPELDANAPYLWNYEVTTFTKGDPTYVEPHVIAIYTQNGVGISEIKEMYAATQDYVEPAKTAFNEDAPILSSINKYLWCYEIIAYTDGTSDETIPHVVGVYGDDGKGIATTVVKYADSTNGTQWPTAEAEWETTIPTVAAGNYLWTRTVITYTDGSKSTAYSVSKVGADGEQGRGVQNVVEQYYLSTNNGTTTGGSWSNTCPPWEEGKYYWTRSYITWDDGTSNGTTPVLANGLNDSIAAAQKASQDLADFSESVTGDITELQKQLDGQIETWFYEGVPSSTTLPESEWSAADKKNHVGDLYYDKLTGSCYRYMLDGSTYVWYEIKDTEVATALETAQAAKDTADSKRRVFVAQPTPPYDIGDLWANGTDLYKCKVARTSGSYVSTDWEKATKYTDDTTANNALDKANAKIRQVDVQYALSSAVDKEPSGTGTEVWTTTAPEWTEGKYMWQRTRYYIGDSTTPTYSDATCIAGAKGMGIASSTVEYQVGTSGTTPPTGTWSPTPVTAAEGKYLWTRTTIKYTDSSVDDSISYSVAYQGTKGADAKTVTITSNNGQVFKKAKGATAFTPSTITLTATLTGGLSGYQWYKDGTAMSGKTSATLEVASSAPGVYKCISGTYSDSMTLVQITDGSDGAKGTSYYTYIKYGTDANGANMTATPTASTKYIGVYSGTASTAPTTASSYTWSKYAGEDGGKGDKGDSGTSYYVWIKYADTTTPASSAMYDSPTGRTYVGIYSGTSSTAPTAYGSYKWSKIQGSDGTGYTILLSNESHTFPGSSTSAAAAATAETKITAYKNTTQQTITVNTVGGTAPGTSSSAATATGVSGLTCYITNNGTNTPILTFKSSTSLTTTSGNIAIVMAVDGKSFTKYFSFSIALKGGKGDTGNGITSTTIKYQVTTSGTSTPPDSGWKNSIAEAGGAGQGKYLWTQTTLTYADGSTKVSLTNSYQGKDGEKGLSITSIKNQYQASQYTSNATDLTSTEWADICPAYNSQKPHIWYRQYVTWSEGDPTITTPVLLESLSNTTKTAYDTHSIMTRWASDSDQTKIDGAQIYTGSIGAEQIYVEDLIALDATIAGWIIGEDEIYTSEPVNNLPAEYEEFEYLGLNTHNFNTGVKRDSTSTLLKVEMDMMYVGYGDSQNDLNVLTIGTDENDLCIKYEARWYQGQCYTFSINGSSGSTAIKNPGVGLHYVFDETDASTINATLTVDKGSDYGYLTGSYTRQATNTTDTLRICNSTLSSTSIDDTYVGVKKCIISKNGTVVRTYVACQRRADKVFGFYDLTNKTFTALSTSPRSQSKPGYVGLASTDISAAIGGKYSHSDYRIIANNAFGVRKNGQVYSTSIQTGVLILDSMADNNLDPHISINGYSSTGASSTPTYSDSNMGSNYFNIMSGDGGVSSIMVPGSRIAMLTTETWNSPKAYMALASRNFGGMRLEVNPDYSGSMIRFFRNESDGTGSIGDDNNLDSWDSYVTLGYHYWYKAGTTCFGIDAYGNSEEGYGSPLMIGLDDYGNYTGKIWLNAPQGLYDGNGNAIGGAGTVLYNGSGSNGSVTLSDYTSNYDYILIQHFDDNFMNEEITLVYCGAASSSNFGIHSAGGWTASELTVAATTYYRSGKSLTVDNGGGKSITFTDTTPSSSGTSSGSRFYIMKVIGYKF